MDPSGKPSDTGARSHVSHPANSTQRGDRNAEGDQRQESRRLEKKKEFGGFAYRLNFAKLVWSAGADKLTVLGEAFPFWPHALNRAEVHRNGSTQRLCLNLNKTFVLFLFRCWGSGPGLISYFRASLNAVINTEASLSSGTSHAGKIVSGQSTDKNFRT